jgi:alpha-L-arabinofuranosidase
MKTLFRTMFALILCSIALMAAADDKTAAVPANTLVIHADRGKIQINRNIYGHFAEHLGRCIYEGVWVGEDSNIPNTRGIRNDVVAALKRIKVPVLRWPGGCFADEYHWRDGVGPREKRPSTINTNWGGVSENNHFGTHEFLDLCGQIGCEPYICGNLGSGTVQEMQQWIEYVTLPGGGPMADLRKANGRAEPWRLTYFGVGNENWGCGGGMTPEYYADQYRRYATFIKNYGSNNIYKIACGPCGDDYRWTEVLMQRCGPHTAGLALHYYCGSGVKSHSATQFGQEDWFHQLRRAAAMDELIVRHGAIMDKFDPNKKVALVVDEWGAWHAVEPGTHPRFLYQQNSLRDALVAGVTLNVFNRHCDRVRMANIAQTINVLQAVILTNKEKMILTPTFHVFEMYVPHQDATWLPTDLTCADYAWAADKMPGLSASASRDRSGKIHVTLCNLNPNQPAALECRLEGSAMKSMSGRVLTAAAMTAHNTFDNLENVKPAEFTDFQPTDAGFRATLPAKSVVAVEINL